jgi:hypothetical protein
MNKIRVGKNEKQLITKEFGFWKIANKQGLTEPG